MLRRFLLTILSVLESNAQSLVLVPIPFFFDQASVCEGPNFKEVDHFIKIQKGKMVLWY